MSDQLCMSEDVFVDVCSCAKKRNGWNLKIGMYCSVFHFCLKWLFLIIHRIIHGDGHSAYLTELS